MGNAEDSGASTDIGVFRTIDLPGAVGSFASGINSEGKIVGGYQSADGHYHGFLLHRDQEWISSLGPPKTGNENANSPTPSDRANRSFNALPENVRSILRQRLHRGRFGIPPMDQQ
jgi:probable HAF family extracellular repeat protein